MAGELSVSATHGEAIDIIPIYNNSNLKDFRGLNAHYVLWFLHHFTFTSDSYLFCYRLIN